MKTSFLRIDKITSLLFMLISFVACQNEEIVESQQTDQFTLKVEKGFGSRTQADEAGTVTWSKGDKMLVYGDNVEGVLTLQGEGGETTGTFSGFVFGNPDNLKWAIYPAEGAKTTEKGAEINLSKITYPNSNSPMVGEISGDKTVQLDHLCGMVRIPVENIPANAKVSLSSTDIAGTAEWDGANFTPTSSDNTIEIEVPVSGNLQIDVPVFATSTKTEKTFKLTIDGIPCEFKSSVAVKKLNKNANLTFKCNVDNTGKVTSIIKEELPSCYLPDGYTFNTTVSNFLKQNSTLDKIKFVAKSKINLTNYTLLSANEEGAKAYLVPNTEDNSLEIHTEGYEFIANKNCDQMFAGLIVADDTPFASIVNINFGNCFNTSNVESMYQMFFYCSSLASLDLSSFNTSNVINMGFMMADCFSLTNLNLSSFNTEKVVSMRYIFGGCRLLKSINITNFNTDNVTDMRGMFEDCVSLTSLDLSNFNTANVTDMKYMFKDCETITSFDLSSFNTEKVTNMSGMFLRCQSLTSLNLSSFNTENVTDMMTMFLRCHSLKELDLSNFRTENVKDMQSMFLECNSLETLNLSSFNTEKGTNMPFMFKDCTNLKEIDLVNFSFKKNNNVSQMFENIGTKASQKTQIKVNSEGYTFLTNRIEECEFNENYATFVVIGENENSYNLPDGSTFNHIVGAFLENNSSLNEIKFIANSQTTSEALLSADENGAKAYMVGNGDCLEIHTSAKNIIANIDCSYMFRENNYDDSKPATFSRIKNIDFGDRFDTSNVLNMSFMFECCESLTKLDVTKFNTSKVFRMESMFSDCASLTSLDVSNFDTSKVTKMLSMFEGCIALTSLNLSTFETSNVTDMRSMFSKCKSLTTLDVTKFNTSKVSHMNNMFVGCASLTTLDVCNFDTSNVTDMSDMFSKCGNLTSLDISNFNTSKVSKMDGMFEWCWNISFLDLTKFSFTKAPTVSGMLEGIGENVAEKPIPIKVTEEGYNYFTETASDCGIDDRDAKFVKADGSGWAFYLPYAGDFNQKVGSYLKQNTQLTKIKFVTNSPTTSESILSTDENGAKAYLIPNGELLEIHTSAIKFVAKEYSSCMFETSENAPFNRIVSIDFGNIDTSNVVNMARMFDGCSSLISLDLSCFNTANVEDMCLMFHNCNALVSLNIGNFNTSNVTDFKGMFMECNSLTSLNFSYFNTENVTNMALMFDDCKSLTSLDLSNFNTSNVTDMNGMFNGCSSLTSLNLSNFDTSKVTTMNSMFKVCSSLTSLNLSNFDTSNVTDMNSMFSYCNSITSLDISNFDTSNVADMSYLFQSCNSLASLNIDNFNTSNVTSMAVMFSGCKSLASLNLGNFTFIKDKIIETDNGQTIINVEVANMLSEMDTNIRIKVTQNGYDYLTTYQYGCGIDPKNFEIINTI